MLDNEYYQKRTKELLNDKYQMPLIYMIGFEHNLTKEMIDNDKHKLYFRTFIIDYLKNET